jgi:sulfite exporter TauE/SafE
MGGAGLPAALFLVGLTGSAAHCAPMCGPFVMAQVTDRLAAVPAPRLCELTRLKAGLLLPYHAGRILTYAGLGAAAAWLGTGAASLPGFRGLSGALLVAAALLFAAQGLKRFLPRFVPHARAPWFGPVMRLASGLDRTRFSGTLALGLLLGLLPCGLLYAALTAAAASADPLRGAAAMAGFGLGTMPALMAIGLVGHAAARRFGAMAATVGPAILLINALVLAGIGWRQLTG